MIKVLTGPAVNLIIYITQKITMLISLMRIRVLLYVVMPGLIMKRSLTGYTRQLMVARRGQQLEAVLLIIY